MNSNHWPSDYKGRVCITSSECSHLHSHYSAPFYKIMVPTVDTVRYNFIIQALVQRGKSRSSWWGPWVPVRPRWPRASAPSWTPQTYSVLTINMSAQTTSNNVQDIIESRVEKRTKGMFCVFVWLLCLCDLFCFLISLSPPSLSSVFPLLHILLLVLCSTVS